MPGGNEEPVIQGLLFSLLQHLILTVYNIYKKEIMS